MIYFSDLNSTFMSRGPQILTTFENVEDQMLYAKALFKSITLTELQTALQARNIKYSKVDSYHILSLRLQAKLLSQAGGDGMLIGEILSEIESFELSVNPKNYDCCVVGCPFKTLYHKSYVKHLRSLHSNYKGEISCQLKGCDRVFNNISLLSLHIKRFHCAGSKGSTVKDRQTLLVERLIRMRCPSSLCSNQIVHSFKELKLHSKWHFNRNQSIVCYFDGCDNNLFSYETFRSHCSRRHKDASIDKLKNGICVDIV